MIGWEWLTVLAGYLLVGVILGVVLSHGARWRLNHWIACLLCSPIVLCAVVLEEGVRWWSRQFQKATK